MLFHRFSNSPWLLRYLKNFQNETQVFKGPRPYSDVWTAL